MQLFSFFIQFAFRPSSKQFESEFVNTQSIITFASFTAQRIIVIAGRSITTDQARLLVNSRDTPFVIRDGRRHAKHVTPRWRFWREQFLFFAPHASSTTHISVPIAAYFRIQRCRFG
jgi:hypothetical protein